MSPAWTVSYVVLWLFVLLLAFLLAGALRQLGLLQLRLGDDPGALITESGLDRGAVAPDFVAVDAESGIDEAFYELTPRASVLVFVSPTCLTCRTLVPALNEVATTRANEFAFVTVCRGDLESCQRFGRINGLEVQLLVDQTGEIEQLYSISMTPFAYLIDHEHRVLLRGVANTWPQLESLLNQEGTPMGTKTWGPVPDDANAEEVTL